KVGDRLPAVVDDAKGIDQIRLGKSVLHADDLIRVVFDQEHGKITEFHSTPASLLRRRFRTPLQDVMGVPTHRIERAPAHNGIPGAAEGPRSRGKRPQNAPGEESHEGSSRKPRAMNGRNEDWPRGAPSAGDDPPRPVRRSATGRSDRPPGSGSSPRGSPSRPRWASPASPVLSGRSTG